MLLNRIAMFLLLMMVFLTGFPHCLRLDIPSFLSLINHILSDSDNSNNNNSYSDNSNNNNSGSSDDSNNNNSGSNNSGSNNSSSDNSSSNNSGSNNSGSNNSGNNNSGNNNSGNNNSGNNNSGNNNSGNNNSGNNNSGNNNSGSSGNTFTLAIGVLDTSFNSPNGFIIQPIGSVNDYGRSLAIQPDGKILLGGYCKGQFNNDFCIARFNSNGTLDTTFGSSYGYIIQPIGSLSDIGQSLAIQPDGKILLSGRCYISNTDFCIARFNSDGTLDTSFGTGGKLTQSIGSSNDFGFSPAIQPDGKILFGGHCYNGSDWDFCIARFNSNGTLDTTFGSPNGYKIQSIGSSNDYGYSLAIQPDGKILLGGYCHNGSNNDFCIARFK